MLHGVHQAAGTNGIIWRPAMRIPTEPTLAEFLVDPRVALSLVQKAQEQGVVSRS